ncbi:IS66 family insertion sequence element accessory protein TnpB [Azospirillum sp. 11R-A]
MDGLAALVQQQLGADPFSGVIYVFRSKRADRVKLLHWDGTGLVLIAKRLEAGQFRWPAIRDGVIRTSWPWRWRTWSRRWPPRRPSPPAPRRPSRPLRRHGVG